VVNKLTHQIVQEPPGVNVHPSIRLDPKTGEEVNKSDYITPQNLVDLVRPYSGTFGHVDFKIKIDSCFAGRFEEPVSDEPNVVAMEFGAQKDETGWWFANGWPRAGSRIHTRTGTRTRSRTTTSTTPTARPRS